MPIYEFKCKQCEKTFETLMLRKDEQIVCPACSSDAVQKLISAHAVGSSSIAIASDCAPSSCGTGRCPMMGGCE